MSSRRSCYVDNVLFFRHYPEPTWLNPHLVDMAWFVMTPFGVVGYVLFLRGRSTAAFACLYLYALMSLLVLGHYLIAPPWRVSFKINVFIMAEAIAALPRPAPPAATNSSHGACNAPTPPSR